MTITRIKNNQITDSTITGVKLVNQTVTGGLLEDNMTYGSNLTVTGNLTVSGTSTTIDTTAMTVEDPIMVLASNQSGAGATDIGFIGERGTDTNIAFVWDESADKFVAATTSNADSSTTVTVSAYADMQLKDLALEDLVASADGSFGGTLTVTGVSTLSGLVVTGSQTISMGSNKVTNVTDPTSAQDAATKSYVDSVSSSGFTLSDGTNSQTVSGGDTLILAGTADEISVAVSATDTMTIGLPDSVVLTSNLTTGGTAYIGSALTVIGTTSAAAITASGTVTMNGDVNLGNASSDTITVTGSVDSNVIPSADATYDLGSSASKWDNIYAEAINTDAAISVGTNLTVGGNLTVSGTTTTVNSTVTTIADPILTLGANTTDDNKDRGIEFKYNDGDAKVGFFGFDDSTGVFTAYTSATNTSEVFTGTAAGATFGAIIGTSGTLSSTLGVTGATTLSSTLDVTGATTLSSTLDVTGATGIDGDFDIATSKFTVDSASGNTSIAGTGSISGATTLGSTLGVTGLATLDGGIQCDTTQFTVSGVDGSVSTTGTLAVSGATTLSSTLGAGASTLASATITGAATVGSTLAVTGATTMAGAVIINEAGADVDVRIEGDADANLFVTDGGTDTVLIGTAIPTTGVKLKVSSTDSMILPVGTTAQRPATGVAGMYRYSTTINGPEYHNGSVWKPLTSEFTVIATETFDGDGTTVAFTLGSAQTSASCMVSLNGVLQLPTTAYAVSGTTLTFTEAPSSTDKIEVRELTTTESVISISNSAGTGMVETSESTANITITAATANFTGNIVASGNITANGDLVFGDAGTDSVTFNADIGSNMIPDGNATRNVGSSASRWNDVYATTYYGDGSNLTGVETDMAISSDSGTGTITVGTDTFVVTGGTNINTSITGDTVTVNLDASPVLSGTPTAPTAASNTNTTQVATTAFVQTELTELIGGAPGTLDTLNELAAAINDDSSYASTLTTALATKVNNADAVSANTANKVVKRDASGNFSAGTITATCTNAQYADLAEKYSADAEIAPGTVVSFGGEAEVTTSSVDGDRKIAGVISTNPAYLMNNEADGVEVALTGRVPCRVTGKIEKGDMLVSAGNGMARSDDDPKLGSVIGKALESNESGDAVIEVVVGRL
jgi:fibronectin-binding autotransporter adhesin